MARKSHLDLARDYIGRGEEYYRKAAEEIVAAMAEDSTLGYAAIAAEIGKSKTWVGDLVRWHTNGRRDDQPTPFAGEDANQRKAASHARTVLRDAPLEQIEQIVSELPDERKAQIAAAAGNAYLGARQRFEEQRESLTPAERGEREAAASEIQRPVRTMVNAFSSMGVVGHLRQATDDLREIIDGGGPTAEQAEAIQAAASDFISELQVALATAGIDAAWDRIDV